MSLGRPVFAVFARELFCSGLLFSFRLARLARLDRLGRLPINRSWRVGRFRYGPVVLFVALAATTAVALEPYGATERAARQDADLDACRAVLDLAEPFGADYSNEFDARGQAFALNCELESWRRGRAVVSPAQTAEREAEINAHLLRLMSRLALGIATRACESVRPQTPSGCLSNVVIARRAAHVTAYILNRYTERSWEPATLEGARELYRSEHWYQGPANGGNSVVPLIGMRLLGGEALGDSVLESRGIAELHLMHGEDLRRGIPEPMSRHYAGPTIGHLELLRETNDPALQKMVDDMLAVRLLVNAHNYLPGGAVGAPNDRRFGPLGILDASGNGELLLNYLSALIHDPDLPAEVGQALATLASDYVMPAAIRSIFLDKAEGYSFWYRGRTPRSIRDGAGYEGERHYPSYGYQGFTGMIPTDYQANPWQTVMLPGGQAQMGIMYAAGGDSGFSNGLFARDGADAFSVYYHHQPRPSDDSMTSWDPLTDDPEWRFEAHTPYRRMMHGRAAISLFEPHDEHDFLLYTIAHLPGEIGVEITECPGPAHPGGSSWLVGQHEGAWVAYLPLGAHTRETREEGGWTFLRFSDGIISGNITEIAGEGEYPDAVAYCADLAGRGVHYDGSTAVAQFETVPPGGSAVSIMLDYFADERSIDSGSGFVAQSDDGFVDKGFMHVEPAGEPSWLKWTGEFSFDLDRAPHPVVAVDFGNPSLPSPAQGLVVLHESAVNSTPFQLVWSHGVDDTGIVEYKIWRDGVEIASVFYDDPNDPFGVGGGRQAIFTETREPANGGEPVPVRYQIESVDRDGNRSLVKSMIEEVVVQATPPTAPVLTSAFPGVDQVALAWTPATDNWGVDAHEVLRNGELLAELGPTESSYLDAAVRADTSYEYVIRARDLAGLSAESAPWSVRTLSRRRTIALAANSPVVASSARPASSANGGRGKGPFSELAARVKGWARDRLSAETQGSCDIDGSGGLGPSDVALFAIARGAKPTDLRWNPAVDLNGDGTISVMDLTGCAISEVQHALAQ
jgi:hypothetical protein